MKDILTIQEQSELESQMLKFCLKHIMKFNKEFPDNNLLILCQMLANAMKENNNKDPASL